ncbi:MAG: PKD domain-containing protein [Nanoarchaeota archaeon]
MRRGLILLSLVIVAILLISPALANVKIQSENLKRLYSGGDTITGIIKVNITNEPANNQVVTNFKGNITLIELIRANNLAEGINYNCSIYGCNAGYEDEGSVNTLSVDSSSAEFVGFKLNRADRIDSLDVVISSDSGPSCSPQLSIDVLGKEEYRLHNTNYTSERCGSKNYGCFDLSRADKKVEIGSEGVCEQMELWPAPAYEISAKITNSTGTTGIIKAELLDEQGGVYGAVGECEMPLQKESVEELKCTIGNPIMERKNYTVCISASGGNYKINAEDSGRICGSARTNLGFGFSFDYEVSAQALEYDEVNFSLNDAFGRAYGGLEIGQIADDYLNEIYGGNCSDGCYIPLLITSNLDQNIDFSRPKAEYFFQGNKLSEETFYSLEKKDAVINAKNMELDLEKAEFTIPLNSSENKLRIFVGGSKIYNDIAINITKGFDFDIIPKFALIGIQTEYSILTNDNISKTEWKFGNSAVKQSNGKSITNRIDEGGEYTLEVKATNTRGAVSIKNIKVIVGDPEESLKQLINQSETGIKKIEEYLNTLPQWAKSKISEKIELEKLKSEVITVKNVDNAGDENKTIALIDRISALNIPISIKESDKGSLPLALGFSNINTKYIEKISASEISDAQREEFTNNLLFWIDENYAPLVEFKVIEKNTASGPEPLVTQISVTLNKKKEELSESYLIIDYPIENIYFAEDYGAIEIVSDETSTGTYILANEENKIEFMVSGKVEFSELGMYISPVVSDIGSYANIDFEKKQFPAGLLTFWVAILIICALVVYIILQEWYKRHYENYLFRNKDDLYNLMNFIYNTRKGSITEQEMKKKLLSNGWSGEQISYTAKKLDGKRTGMFEIPIFRFFEQKKIKEEMEKRQNIGNRSGRFIKRPNLGV